MLTYAVLAITVYLAVEVLRAPSSADAAGYVLVSGLIPLPVYMIGNSVDAGMFPIDVCLLAYIAGHGKQTLCCLSENRAMFAGAGVLFAFSILATCSGAFNFIFVDPDPLKFYTFTIVKFWEYALLATIMIATRPNAAQLRRLFLIALAGVLVYEILHVLQVSGVAPLSGEQYFGPRANSDLGGAVPFSDRTGWFLTSYRGVIGGTASISAWISIMAFEAYRGKIKVIAIATAVLSLFSVLAITSREDTAGLAASAVVFAVFAPPKRWKTYAAALIAVASVYAIFLTCILTPAKRDVEIGRMSELWNPELRAEGNYAGRVAIRTSLLGYLPDHPADLLIGAGPGNFRSYAAKGIMVDIYGHNSYVHWTGELGIGGFLLLLAWCFSVCLYAMRGLRSPDRISQLAARTCLALVAGRMVAAWGGESLFGTDGMGYYSLYFVGVVYLLVSVSSNAAAERSYLHLLPDRFKKTSEMLAEDVAIYQRQPL